ncbi:MAG: GIY-YIG nuclease family protein [Terriglobia bacterium]
MFKGTLIERGPFPILAQRSQINVMQPMMMNHQPGTYALVLAASKAAPVPVGKLGSLQVQPGFYVYVGSAQGPGGLPARLAHHLGPSAHPHWHIDYLEARVTPEEVWYCYDRTSWEHPWAHCLGLQRNASVPMAGFGSSDCLCGSHLFFFRTRPSRSDFARRLGVFDRGHPPVQFQRLKRII